MAFSPYQQHSDNTKTFHLLRRVQDGPQYNLTLRLTAGLATAFNPNKEEQSGGGGLPVLCGRYKPIALLGKGTFSQLIVAEDLYHPHKKQYAIKIMNKNCDYIGIQECQKIHLINHIDQEDNVHVVRMIGHFYFGNHFCIVLELLGCSLLQFMVKSFFKKRM